jgi:CSLREA domain-containing protein
LLLAAGTAHAATFVVTSNVDTFDGSCDANCSLRDALWGAEQTPGADILRLSHPYYRLTEAGGPTGRGQLLISDALVLRGLPERSTIDVNGIDRGFEIVGARVEMIDLTLRNGRGEGQGGAIYNAGDLTLRRVWVIGNRVVPDVDGRVDGGGIFNVGQLRLVACRIERNIARDDATLIGGRGGGIFSDRGHAVYVYDSAIRGNATGLDDISGFGAGMFNLGQARIDRSFFGDNDPGDGEGAAIANRNGASLVLINSTLSNNGHDGADSALANGTLTVTGEASPKANAVNSTIANNNGGGVLNSGRLTLRQSIVAGNYTQDAGDRWYDAGFNCRSELGGTVTQFSSLLGADGNCPAQIFVDNRSVFSTVLEHLRYLGGPTPVHKPRPGPYAIDGGDPDFCPAVDQRAQSRPADGDGNGVAVCDIGAMEVQPGE